MIHALIIDDEPHNLIMLRALLEENCPNINVLDTADSADLAFEKIKEYQPQLIFLDIKMPNKTGFDLLRMFTQINFEVIFVSAFNEYALKAFDFSALDYILKPIDYTKLIKAVSKAEQRIAEKNKTNHLLHFVKTIDEKNDLLHKITLHHKDTVLLLDINDIVFIEGDGDVCNIKTKDNTTYTSSKRLNMFEDLFQGTGNFLRITKSVMVNIHYIKSYSKGEPCIIELVTQHYFEVARRKKLEITALLKTKLR